MSGKYSENILEKKEMVQNNEQTRNKKDRKRPELQIYRPGMGLQNKSVLKPEPVNSSRSNSLTIQHDSSSNESSNSPVDKDTTFKSTASFKTKGQPLSNRMGGEKALEPVKRAAQNSSKNRRPDIQVYVPKPKAIAKLNELSKSRSSSEISECHISDSVNKSEKFFGRCEKSENVFGPNKLKDRHAHSPEIKVYNSNQEMKEKPLPKGRKNKTSVCENIANSFKMQEVRKQQSNSCANFSENLQVSDTTYRKRDHAKKSVCGDKETEKKYAVPKGGGQWYEGGSSSPEMSGTDLSQLSVQNADSSSKSSRNERKRRSDEKKSKNSDLRRGVKNGDSPKNKIVLESGVTFGKADSNVFCTKMSDTREREKYKMHDSNHCYKIYKDHGDYPQPVQKSLSSECLPDERTKGGGILRLPRESLTGGVPLDRPVSVLTEQTLYEPLVIVRQKHLYNPDNPDVPEIVSVPTHMSGPCSPSGHVDYFCPELSPGNVGYIPPPQPSSSARQYSYEVEDFPSLNSISSRNLNVTYSPRSMLSPVQCSIPSPTPPPVRAPAIVPSPTLPFLGTRQEIISSPAPRLSSVYNNQLGLQDTSKKRVKPIVEKNLLDINVLERQLSNYLAEGLLSADQKDLGQCRKHTGKERDGSE